MRFDYHRVIYRFFYYWIFIFFPIFIISFWFCLLCCMQAAGGRPLQGTTLSFAAAREGEREEKTERSLARCSISPLVYERFFGVLRIFFYRIVRACVAVMFPRE